MRRYRIEVWDAANAERLAIFAAPTALVRRRVLKGEETLQLSAALDDPAVAHLTQGNVLRLQRQGEAADFHLWRIARELRQRDDVDATTIEVEAYALWMDFRHGLVRQPQADGRHLATFGLVGLTPTQLLTDFVIPGFQGAAVSFQLGTVDAAVDVPLSLSFERASPLAALRMIEEAAGDGAGAEAQFRLLPDGTGYYVDLLERVGRTSGGAELRYRKNVRGLSRTSDEVDIQTRLYAFGSGLLTLADATWRIGGVASGAITFDGASPVFEDDALVGLWWYVEGKGAYPITASDAGAGTLTVNTASLPALAGGDIGWVATDILGTRLDYLESPEGVAAYDRRVGLLVAEDVPDAANLLTNGDFTAWTGSVPDDWSLEGAPTVAADADPRYVQHGGQTAHVTADDDEGLVSDAVTLPSDTARPYLGMLAGLTVISGRVRMELRHSNGKVYPIQQQPKNEGLGVYLTLSANAHAEPLPAGTVQLAIVAHGGPAEFYLDCAMVTPQLAADVPAFVADSGAHVLWQRAAVDLADRRRPKVEYNIDVVDLYHADPDAFPYDELELGDDVKVRDPQIGRETQRIVELDEDLLAAEATHVVVAPSVRERVPDPSRPAPPSASGGIGTGGARVPTSPESPAILHHAPQYDRDLGELFIPVLANARTATIELQTRASLAAAWPASATDTISDRSGIFGGIALADGEQLVYRLRGLDGAGVPGEWVEGAWNGDEPVVPDPFGQVDVFADSTGALRFNAHGNAEALSFRWAASKSAMPNTPGTTVSAREQLAIDTGLTLAEGETGYVAVWFYSELAGGGVQGQRVAAQYTRPDVPAAGTAHITVREYAWVFEGGFTDRRLDLTLRYSDQAASLVITYSDVVDPSPNPAIGGSYSRNVSGGPSTIVETVKQNDGTTVQLWPYGVGRPDVSVTVLAYDGAGGTGTLLGTDQITVRQDEGISPVVLGGTGLDAVTSGALMRGAGTDPLVEVVGATAGEVPRWNGSAFVASRPQWGDLQSVPSTFTPSAHATSHGLGGGDPLSLDASQIATGEIPIARGGTGRVITSIEDPSILYYDGSGDELSLFPINLSGTSYLRSVGGVLGWATISGTVESAPGADYFYQSRAAGANHGWSQFKGPSASGFISIDDGKPLVGFVDRDGDGIPAADFGTVAWQYVDHPTTIAGYGIADDVAIAGEVNDWTARQNVLDVPIAFRGRGSTSTSNYNRVGVNAAAYRGASGETGAILIRTAIPETSNTMFYLRVAVYHYSGTLRGISYVYVSGYRYQGGMTQHAWWSEGAWTPSGVQSMVANGVMYIAIGSPADVHQYVHAWVTEAQVGHSGSGQPQYLDGWTISIASNITTGYTDVRSHVLERRGILAGEITNPNAFQFDAGVIATGVIAPERGGTGRTLSSLETGLLDWDGSDIVLRTLSGTGYVVRNSDGSLSVGPVSGTVTAPTSTDARRFYQATGAGSHQWSQFKMPPANGFVPGIGNVGRALVLIDAVDPEVGFGDVSWTYISGKPATFPPSTHSHAWGDITSGVPVYATRWPTLGEIGAAAASHSHGSFTVADIRDTNPTPNTTATFTDNSVTAQFNNAWSGVGSGWRSALSVKGWNSSYSVWQLIGPASTSADDDLYFRSGAGSTWRTPVRILHAGNSGGLAIQSVNFGTYGAIGVTGSKNGYSGIWFADAARYLMVSATVQGIHDGSTWQWYWNNGVLTAGTVPAARVTAGGFPSGVFSFNDTVRLHGGGSSSYTSAGTLALKTAANNAFISWHNSAGTRLGYIQFSSSLVRIAGETAVPMLFDTNGAGTNRMRIEASGNVGIGYSSDQGYRLAVAGSVYASSSLTAAGQITALGGLAVTGDASVTGALTEGGQRVAKVIISSSTPSGSAPHGTFWVQPM